MTTIPIDTKFKMQQWTVKKSKSVNFHAQNQTTSTQYVEWRKNSQWDNISMEGNVKGRVRISEHAPSRKTLEVKSLRI